MVVTVGGGNGYGDDGDGDRRAGRVRGLLLRVRGLIQMRGLHRVLGLLQVRGPHREPGLLQVRGPHREPGLLQVRGPHREPGLLQVRGIRRVRGLRQVLVVVSLGGLLAGCGIRATEVPTDFGPAPSRVRCSLSEPDVTAQSARVGVPVQVFLLCGSSLVAVDRAVRITDGSADSERRAGVAQGLLDQLAESPSAAEKEAGYTTDVRGGMTVDGPGPRDPDDALRLSVPPETLTSFALAQLVCTFSDSAAAEGDGSVVLGGSGNSPLRRYECTDEVRSRPGSTEPPSTAVTDGG